MSYSQLADVLHIIGVAGVGVQQYADDTPFRPLAGVWLSAIACQHRVSTPLANISATFTSAIFRAKMDDTQAYQHWKSNDAVRAFTQLQTTLTKVQACGCLQIGRS